jgi:hypothetical protein
LATSPTSEELLKAYTDKLLSEFEQKSAVIFYDLSIGLQNRITKEMNVVTKYIWQIMDCVRRSEAPRDQDQDVQTRSPRGSWINNLPSRRMDTRPRAAARRSA